MIHILKQQKIGKVSFNICHTSFPKYEFAFRIDLMLNRFRYKAVISDSSPFL